MKTTIVKKVTIANGTSLSDEVDMSGLQLVAIQMPSGWTTANLTFQAGVIVSQDGKNTITYGNVLDDGGTEVVVTAAASGFITIRPTVAAALRGIKFLKVRSGTSATPVNQAAARIITLSFRCDY
jgi:hypothetical protein